MTLSSHPLPLYLDPSLLDSLASSLGLVDDASSKGAARLVQVLSRVQGDLRTPSGPGDLSGLAPGELVSFSGQLRRSPIADMVDVVTHLMSGADNPEAYRMPDDTVEIVAALRAQLDSSPIIEALLTSDEGLTAVVALRRSAVSSPSLDELRFGRVTVVGKVAQVIGADETWSMTSRSFITHVLDGAIRDLATGLAAFSPQPYPLGTGLKGPALLVHPLSLTV
ncbi:MAG: hypothetical protein ACI9OJ_003924 [Myxococcota bacterium]|jgi:hypothetical protein